jgi:Domain of unknown function (DUF5666)
MLRRQVLTAALMLGLTALPAFAQSGTPTRVRGTIEAVTSDSLTVHARTGDSVTIKLNDPLTVQAVGKVDLATIGEHSYVGVTTRPGPNGSLIAVEVHVFPEAMRGAGEGSRPWDLEPGSLMTNGTVTGAVTATDGRQLTVQYKEGSKTVVVPAQTPIVTFMPAERADLKPGVPVFVIATQAADGTLSSGRVMVGKNGVAPPM